MTEKERISSSIEARAAVLDRDDRSHHSMERIGVLEAMRWHWITVLIPVIVFAAAGVALATLRTPTYTADSRLQVQVTAHTPSELSAAISSSNSLAAGYARDLDAKSVQARIAHAAKVPVSVVGSDVSATPIQNTNVLTVSASAKSSHQATTLANAGTDALRRYVARLDTGGTTAKSTITRQTYNAIHVYQHRLNEQQRLERAAAKSHSLADRQALRQAQFQTQVALMNRTALQQAFSSNVLHYAPAFNVLAPATSATSDRTSTAQIFGLVGALAGLAIGAGLATWRANRMVKGYVE